MGPSVRNVEYDRAQPRQGHRCSKVLSVSVSDGQLRVSVCTGVCLQMPTSLNMPIFRVEMSVHPRVLECFEISERKSCCRRVLRPRHFSLEDARVEGGVLAKLGDTPSHVSICQPP
jgi:hypothetical protein